MAQQHLDRLTAIDASFLAQEHASSHMHVGALAVFEGPAPAYEDVLDHIRSRLHLVPRYRQKLAFPPIEMGMPLWIDDPSFNLEYHIRHTALPDPGSEDQLLLLTARIFSQRLDRSKPLWELWLVEGLEGGSFASSPRPITRWWTGCRVWTSQPCSSISLRCRSRSSTTAAPGSRTASPAAPSSWPRACAASCARASSWPAAR
jgi:hypothetical protein